MNVAIAIGQNADRLRRKRMSEKDKRKIRTQEVCNKIEVLRGGAGTRYMRHRDEDLKVGDTSKNDSDSTDDGADADAEVEEEQVARPQTLIDWEEEAEDGEAGEGQAGWSFQRADPIGGRTAKPTGTVSDTARAVAATELVPGGGKASSQTIIDAAMEFDRAHEFEQASELLEVARTRIDRDQLERKIANTLAQELDDMVVWHLAECYVSQKRLTLAFDRYSILKGRLLETRQQMKALRSWAEVAFMLGEELYNVRRYVEALQVFETVRDTTLRNQAGEQLRDDVELFVAMSLQGIGKTREAQDVLVNIRTLTYSKNTKARASFILDVISVDTSGERNEEFHKMWDEHFKLPSDSVRAGTYRVGSSGNLHLTETERKLRTWASQYWEERLKSPLYYAFLTLWVTWPFAIPVVSIMNKMN